MSPNQTSDYAVQCTAAVGRVVLRQHYPRYKSGAKCARKSWAKSPNTREATGSRTVWKRTPPMSIFDNTTFEIWLPIKGFVDFYSISNQARVRSEHRIVTRGEFTYTVAEKFMSISPNTDGYLTVKLTRDGISTTYYVHDLLLQAFVGPKPEGLEVRHLDDDKGNCRLTNLAYGSHAQNMADSVRNGTHAYASRTECSQGHPYDAENTAYHRSHPTRRVCRTCARDYQLRHQSNRELVSA